MKMEPIIPIFRNFVDSSEGKDSQLFTDMPKFGQKIETFGIPNFSFGISWK